MQPIQYVMANDSMFIVHSHIHTLNYRVLVFPTFHMRAYFTISSYSNTHKVLVEFYCDHSSIHSGIVCANDGANFFPSSRRTKFDDDVFISSKFDVSFNLRRQYKIARVMENKKKEGRGRKATQQLFGKPLHPFIIHLIDVNVSREQFLFLNS